MLVMSSLLHYLKFLEPHDEAGTPEVFQHRQQRGHLLIPDLTVLLQRGEHVEGVGQVCRRGEGDGLVVTTVGCALSLQYTSGQSGPLGSHGGGH